MTKYKKQNNRNVRNSRNNHKVRNSRNSSNNRSNCDNHNKQFFSRNKQREFINDKVVIYGKHPVLLAIKACQRKIYKIYVNKKFEDSIFNYLQVNNLNSLSTKLKLVDVNFLDSLFKSGVNYQKINHQGFVIEASKKNRLSLGVFIKKCVDKENLPKLLILDQLTDPHNIGAIIRTAAAFGVQNIITTVYNFPQENSTIIKASAGMTEFVDLIETVNLNHAIEELKKIGYSVVGLDGNAELLIKEVKIKNIALVLGSEGKGIRSLVRQNCDMLVKIPMSEKVESLNASVAGAIGIYEIWGK
jgi:23S rRNA (guanosine2251-2'-O)-methyltransferase